MPDAATVLKQDHRKVEGLFQRFQDGDYETIPEICEELTVHTEIEESVLYPALPEVREGDALRDEAEKEHGEVKKAIQRLQAISEDSDEVDALMETIIAGVSHHVEEEESQIFPKLEKELGPERMSQLGEDLLAEKREQLASIGRSPD